MRKAGNPDKFCWLDIFRWYPPSGFKVYGKLPTVTLISIDYLPTRRKLAPNHVICPAPNLPSRTTQNEVLTKKLRIIMYNIFDTNIFSAYVLRNVFIAI